MRSAAELNAAAIAASVALLRSDATMRASCSAASSSSTRRMRWPCSVSSSATISAAITVSRMSPISPKSARSRAMRASRSCASRAKWSSCPSSHAIRYCRLLMVTLTWPMERACPLRILALVRLDDRADRRDRLVELLGDLPVGALESARAGHRGIELFGKPRAVGIEGVDLRGERRLSLIPFEPPLDRSLKRIERGLQTLGRQLDRTDVVHTPPRRPALPSRNCLRGKMLSREPYVACGLSVNVGNEVINGCGGTVPLRRPRRCAFDDVDGRRPP